MREITGDFLEWKRIIKLGLRVALFNRMRQNNEIDTLDLREGLQKLQ